MNKITKFIPHARLLKSSPENDADADGSSGSTRTRGGGGGGNIDGAVVLGPGDLALKTPMTPAESLHAIMDARGGIPRPLYLGIIRGSSGGAGCSSGAQGSAQSGGGGGDFEVAPIRGYELHQPMSMDASKVVVQADVEVGDLCVWHSLTAKASVRELESAAREAGKALRFLQKGTEGTDVEGKEDVYGDANAANAVKAAKAIPLRCLSDTNIASVVGAIAFTCCGRGARFHDGQQNMDSKALRAGMPGLPVVGIFANGEIGPPPHFELGGGVVSGELESNMAGFTCSSVICRFDGQV